MSDVRTFSITYNRPLRKWLPFIRVTETWDKECTRAEAERMVSLLHTQLGVEAILTESEPESCGNPSCIEAGVDRHRA